MTRREFLAGATAAMALAAIDTSVHAHDELEQVLAWNSALPMKAQAAAAGLQYGTSARKQWLQSDPGFAALVAREAAVLVPELELKMDALRPAADRFDFEAGDWMCDFAQNNSMAVRGHTLVWFNALPPWFGQEATKKNAAKLMEEHIHTVMGHYKGKIQSWDVVNEPIAHDEGRLDGLRVTPWLQLLGPEYIEMAFRMAAEADPTVQLVLNETWLEGANAAEKRMPTLRLLQDLRSKGVPLQALGMQGHIRGGERQGGMQLREFIREVENLGLEVLITEMDVRDQALPWRATQRDLEVARTYFDFLKLVLDSKSIKTIVNWGLTDKYTWITKHSPARADGLSARPLPFDENFQKKPAWNAITYAFSTRSQVRK